LRPDPGEFHAVRWWPFDRVDPGEAERRIGPGIDRFLTKVTALVAPPGQGAARSPS
jgi:hypothetical protein